jgi:hypothetical protein
LAFGAPFAILLGFAAAVAARIARSLFSSPTPYFLLSLAVRI